MINILHFDLQISLLNNYKNPLLKSAFMKPILNLSNLSVPPTCVYVSLFSWTQYCTAMGKDRPQFWYYHLISNRQRTAPIKIMI